MKKKSTPAKNIGRQKRREKKTLIKKKAESVKPKEGLRFTGEGYSTYLM